MVASIFRMETLGLSRRTFLVIGTALAAAPVVRGELPTGVSSIGQDDEQSVRELITSFAAAWSRHDVKGMGELHTDDVNFTNIWGLWLKDRSSTEQGFAAGHSGIFSQSKMVIDIEQVRFPVPNVAVAQSTMELLDVPPAFGGKCHSIRVLVKNNGRWLISDFQNTQIRKPPQ